MFLNNPECIHSAVFAKAKETPNAIALVSRNMDGSYNQKTYAELSENALKIASALKAAQIKSKDLIAIVLPKGMNQVFCALGIQAVGAAYVPVGIHQPAERMRKIFDTANISGIITDANRAPSIQKEIPDKKIFIVEDALQAQPMPIDEIIEDPANLAYIIFTSGTTGIPKGVMISHRSASNTIRDINLRYHVTASDACIAISELDFDLSVYDIFGMLSAGGKLIVLSEETKKEANIWKAIAKEQKITLWNSVPALFEMFTIVLGKNAEGTVLKTVLLSGDWIPLHLFETTKTLWPSVKFISLGGATEASIWSVYYEVEAIFPYWKSIPYGKALKNQSIRVMNEYGKECVPGEAGELWIGGKGVAEGYLNQPDLTKERFIERNGERWYRTGDKARMLVDGNSEFLGRLDTQIKLGGYRIELGEIENVIKKSRFATNACAVVVEAGEKKEIVAAVIPQIQKDRVQFEKSFEASKDENFETRQKSVHALIQMTLFNIPDIHSPVVDFWKDWSIKNENVSGAQISTDIANEENANLLSEIILGKRSVNELLNKDLFNPETLIAQSDSLKHFMEKVATDVSKIIVPKVAFLNARSGFAAESLLKAIDSPDISITLFDESNGMLSLAKERLSMYGEKISYKIFDLTSPIEDIESFDIIIDAGFLHVYKKPIEVISFAYNCLKKGGKFFALDFENFDPIAIVSSAVLENGFETTSRARSNTPLLTDAEWESIWTESAFEKVSFKNKSHFEQEIIADKFANSGSILGKDFDNYLYENLVPYMIPARYDSFVKFPLTPNGKIDRKRIAELLKKNFNEVVDDQYEGKEAEVANIWKNLLNISKISRKANFFEMGGDSLLATKFLEIVHTKFGVDVTLREFFENSKLNILAKIIEERIEALGDMEEGEI